MLTRQSHPLLILWRGSTTSCIKVEAFDEVEVEDAPIPDFNEESYPKFQKPDMVESVEGPQRTDITAFVDRKYPFIHKLTGKDLVVQVQGVKGVDNKVTVSKMTTMVSRPKLKASSGPTPYAAPVGSTGQCRLFNVVTSDNLLTQKKMREQHVKQIVEDGDKQLRRPRPAVRFVCLDK